MKKFLILASSFAAVAAMADVTTVLEGTQNGSGAAFSALSLAAGSKTILTVPYQTCTTTGKTIKLNELVSANGLPSAATSDSAESAARLYVLPAGSTSIAGNYKTYYNNSTSGWTKYGTTTDEASALSLASGDGIWLIMPSTSGTAYLKGDVVTSQSITVSHGYNLIGAASADAYNLGSLSFTTPTTATRKSGADQILIQNGTSYTVYYYINGAWHSNASTTVDLSTITIPAGQGFWYYRYSTADMTVSK